MSPEEICLHLGDEYTKHLGAISPPIYQTSLFTRKTGSSGYSYTRTNNPTVEIAEVKIAALEGAEAARCFSSGMAAISAAIMHCVKAGSHVIAPRNVYLPTRALLSDYLSRFGVETTFVGGDDTDEFASAIRDETSLIYLESPVSNIFTLQDIAAVTALAKARGIATIADNSWATPLYQKPHSLGVDIVVHSASKYLGGHSDIVAGVATGRTETMESIRHTERGLYGGSMDPHQAWLLIRSLRTLPLRMRAHRDGGMAVARFLESHRRVERVLYPGLDSHRQAGLAKRQMTGTTGLLGFVPRGSAEAISKALSTLEFFEIGPSWGGYESLLNTPGVGIDETRSRESGIPMGLVRLSIGLEEPEALIEDLDRMLGRLG